MTPDHIDRWIKDHPLSPIHVDCVTTVMLKILDGKCKMKTEEKVVMALLYDQTKNLPGELLDETVHQLITDARANLDDAMKNFIYEKRLLAETMISRPIMKGFKSLIREQGLFDAALDEAVS